MAASIGVPISAHFNSAGTAVVEVISPESFVWTGADKTINHTMSAATFNDAFVLSEDPANDAAADLAVSMSSDVSKQAAFREALKVALVNGEGDLQAWLEGFAQAELDESLANNGIPAAVEGEVVTSISITDFAEDASGGAATMWNNMAAANESDYLNIIARQIPRNRFPETFDGKMYAATGDTVTFRFNIDQTYGISTAATAPLTGAGVAGAADGLSTNAGTNVGITSRAIDLVLTLA